MTLPDSLQSSGRTHVVWRGAKFSCFSGCDYFRLSSDPRVVRAIQTGLESFGLSVSASRVTTGNHELYSRVEQELARFFSVPAATLVSTGYLAGLSVAQALAGECLVAFIDERSHPALWDAAHALQCPVESFGHKDARQLGKMIAGRPRSARLVVLTDGMFAFDGSLAPIPDYLQLLRRNSVLLVDDAHAAGVVGKKGAGTCDHFEIRDQRIIQLITLSKAFGVYGGVVLSGRDVQEKIHHRSAAYIGSTPLPLPLANGVLTSIEILTQEGVELRERARANCECVRNTLTCAGVQIPDAAGPILSLHCSNGRTAALLSAALRRARIHPPFLRYPGGAQKGFFRFVISSEHTPDQLNRLARTLVKHRSLLAGGVTMAA